MAFGHRHLGAACIPFHHVGAGDWFRHGDSNPGRETENLASWPLDDAGKGVEETLGFEPREGARPPTIFETAAINRSATSPNF